MGAVNAVKAAGGLLQFVKATNLAKAAQVAFNFVMNMNPIGAIVTAISALVAGLGSTSSRRRRQAGRHGRRSPRPSTASWIDQIRVVVRHGVHLLVVDGHRDGVSGFFDLRRAAPADGGRLSRLSGTASSRSSRQHSRSSSALSPTRSSSTFRHG